MLREWNQLPDAEHHLLQGLAWSRGRMMDAETLSLGYSALARVYTAQGRFDQAEAVLLECAQVGEDRNFAPHLTARLGAERARCSASGRPGSCPCLG